MSVADEDDEAKNILPRGPTLPTDLAKLKLAAVVMSEGDPQDVLRERFEGLRGMSELERFVCLAAAKRAYEKLHPETAHGKRKTGKKDDHPSFREYAAKLTGWKADTIQKWIAVGDRIAIEAYRKLQGPPLSPLANRIGALKRMAAIHQADQIDVAHLAREAAKTGGSLVPACRKLEQCWSGGESDEGDPDLQLEQREAEHDPDLLALYGDGQHDCVHCHGTGQTIEACTFIGCTLHRPIGHRDGLVVDEE